MIAQHGTLNISRSRLLHNLGLIRAAIGGAPQICATIKANAYGHGVSQIAPLLRAAGIDWACVYSLDEALSLAPFDWSAILVLAPLVLTGQDLLHDALVMLFPKVRVNITDADSARHLALALASVGNKSPIHVHMQIDTGLTRAGVDPAEADALVAQIAIFAATPSRRNIRTLIPWRLAQPPDASATNERAPWNLSFAQTKATESSRPSAKQRRRVEYAQ